MRSYEVDSNGHVNNSVYFQYAEALTTEHAELSGFGRNWSVAHGGVWVIHRNQAVYHRPAVYGDELELTVEVESLEGVRGVRRTSIGRLPGPEPVAEIVTEWVWIRLRDGRPVRVPPELMEVFSRG